MLEYLRRLSAPRLVLWCYFLWWAVAVGKYFDPSPRLWLSSLGISGIIGTALYLSTAHASGKRTVLDRWQVFRFFLMPFCVSSFAALIKGRGFVLVFHPSLRDNAQAVAACATLGGIVWLAKTYERRAAQPSITTGISTTTSSSSS